MVRSSLALFVIAASDLHPDCIPIPIVSNHGLRDFFFCFFFISDLLSFAIQVLFVCKTEKKKNDIIDWLFSFCRLFSFYYEIDQRLLLRDESKLMMLQ